MITWQSWYCQPWKRLPPPRKKEVSDTGHQILLYCTVFVGCMSFSSAGASYIPLFWRATLSQLAPPPHDWIMFFDVLFIKCWQKKEYRHPLQYWLDLPRLRWQWQACHPWKHWRCRCRHRWLWNWSGNYFLGAQYCLPSYPLTISTGQASMTSGLGLKNIVMKTRQVQKSRMTCHPCSQIFLPVK